MGKTQKWAVLALATLTILWAGTRVGYGRPLGCHPPTIGLVADPWGCMTTSSPGAGIFTIQPGANFPPGPHFTIPLTLAGGKGDEEDNNTVLSPIRADPTTIPPIGSAQPIANTINGGPHALSPGTPSSPTSVSAAVHFSKRVRRAEGGEGCYAVCLGDYVRGVKQAYRDLQGIGEEEQVSDNILSYFLASLSLFSLFSRSARLAHSAFDIIFSLKFLIFPSDSNRPDLAHTCPELARGRPTWTGLPRPSWWKM